MRNSAIGSILVVFLMFAAGCGGDDDTDAATGSTDVDTTAASPVDESTTVAPPTTAAAATTAAPTTTAGYEASPEALANQCPRALATSMIAPSEELVTVENGATSSAGLSSDSANSYLAGEMGSSMEQFGQRLIDASPTEQAASGFPIQTAEFQQVATEIVEACVDAGWEKP
jgi:hypothetical protein